MQILSNGATIIIVVLLVLAIAYRYYSAFLAAKVLALDPNRTTPAHGLKDGQNYHPTNKWVLFGHHFAAISGAGPLIGPVLAAQFGYLPGLIWILVGVCLAGAVQDFVVLTLSTRRNGRSLAQIAYAEIGTPAGAAATIGILFVLVIALAGLGKVVTTALGGDTVTYQEGTQFVAQDRALIVTASQQGSVSTYDIPAGTHVIYPAGADGQPVTKDASAPIMLNVEGKTGAPVDIEDQTMPPGLRLRVLDGTAVSREDGDKTAYPAGTTFYAPAGKPIPPARLQDNAYHYVLPAGTTIVLRDQANKPIVTTGETRIVAAAPNLKLTGRPLQIGVPYGATVNDDTPEKTSYPAQTQFVSGAQPITALGMADNLYRFRIPQGTRIVDPQQNDTTAATAFTITVETSDIMVTRAHGYRLVVPAEVKATEEIAGSSWGTFTIALTIPIALFVGVYMYRIRRNKVLEASIIGGLLTLGAVYLGGRMNADDSMLAPFREYFNLRGEQVGYAMALYGFIAGILPVWMLLCPRDYLSSFLKIGTVALLVVGVIAAHPAMRAPALNAPFFSRGPVLGNAPIFPFLFITIMCGAVSGFHALVASGTTPKMLNKEADARTIGYGAMLMEGLVAIVALIAASAMPVSQYYDINTPAAKVPEYQRQIAELGKNDRLANNLADPDEPLPDVGEHVQGRTGGAVTLAIGMADIFNGAVNNIIGNPKTPPAWMSGLYSYWYHFAIMFEALFILTTIDTGTRVGRFLLQETMGRWIAPALGKTDSWPSAILATGLISLGWWYFLRVNAFDAIWAMFGIANQMLAVMALAVASAALARGGKRKYVWVTLGPLCFVAITTTSAAVWKLIEYIGPSKPRQPAAVLDYFVRQGAAFEINPLISALCVIAIVICTGVVVIGSLKIVRRSGKEPAIVETSAAS